MAKTKPFNSGKLVAVVVAYSLINFGFNQRNFGL